MKARKVLGIIAGVIAALYGILYVAFYDRTLPIEGVIVDAKTGKPVSKVFVNALWYFRVPNLVDTTGDGDSFGTVTDDQGRFEIPGKNVTSVISEFVDLNLHIQHPLYAFERVQIYIRKNYRKGVVDSGVLELQLPMTSLEDKYLPGGDMSELSRVIGEIDQRFYRLMRERFGTRYDLEEIMANLENLALRASPQGSKDNVVYRAYLRHRYLMSEFMRHY